MKIVGYKEAVEYLESFISPILFKRIEENPKFDPLERMRVLLKLLGNPEQKFKSVLVTGTAGKGSTSYLISHILTISGFKVGFTLSPHLQKVNERLQINGEQISDEKFIQLTASMIRIIEMMRNMEVGGPSYFEILIAMAFTYFASQKVDIAVVEVGIEGKYDATNVLNPLIVVLTNIYLDHTQILGNTVEEIAKEASGAIKKSNTVITGVKQATVIEIVEERCRQVGAKLFRLGKDFNLSNTKDYELGLIGDYQRENASLAVEAVLKLKTFGFKVSKNIIREALQTAFFPGRFEVVNDKLVLDGAHNPDKMKAFVSSLEKLYPKEKKVFLIAFKKDKNIKDMLLEILKSADSIIVTEFGRATDVGLHSSANSSNLKSQISNLKSGTKVIVEKDLGRALKKAFDLTVIEQSNNRAIIVVTGSLYLVGEIRSSLK